MADVDGLVRRKCLLPMILLPDLPKWLTVFTDYSQLFKLFTLGSREFLNVPTIVL